MANKPKGKNVVIKGVIYEDDPSSIYDSKHENDKKIKFDQKGSDSVVGETVANEVASQSATSGIQAVVAQVQTQAANLGASGLIAVGSAGAFQVEHMNDNYEAALEIATPIVVELVETGTISLETIAVVLPPDSKFQGKQLPVAETVLGKPVGEYKKQLDAEKAKSDEQKAIEKAIQDATSPPDPSKSERDGSMTYREEQDWSMT